MLKAIGVIVILLAIVGIVAYSQGWISISTTDVDGKKNVTISADKDKATTDLKKAETTVIDAVTPKK
jgi:hypothetical protein